MRRRSLVVLLIGLMIAVAFVPTQTPAEAHPGGTDGNGCHTCRTNCTESWGIPYGYYHRHHPVRDCFEATTTTTTRPPTTTTTRAPTTTTTTSSTTTTSAPPDVTSTGLPPPQEGFTEFRLALAEFSADIAFLTDEAIRINAAWEERSADYGTTLSELRQLQSRVDGLLTEFRRVSVPDELAEVRRGALDAATLLATPADQMLAGLKAPDDGSDRRAALADFESTAEQADLAIQSLSTDIDYVEESARIAPPATTTTQPTTAPTPASPAPEAVSDSVSFGDSGGLPTGWLVLAGLVFAYAAGSYRGRRAR